MLKQWMNRKGMIKMAENKQTPSGSDVVLVNCHTGGRVPYIGQGPRYNKWLSREQFLVLRKQGFDVEIVEDPIVSGGRRTTGTSKLVSTSTQTLPGDTTQLPDDSQITTDDVAAENEVTTEVQARLEEAQEEAEQFALEQAEESALDATKQSEGSSDEADRVASTYEGEFEGDFDLTTTTPSTLESFTKSVLQQKLDLMEVGYASSDTKPKLVESLVAERRRSKRNK